MTKMEINVLVEYVRAWIVAHELNEKFFELIDDNADDEKIEKAKAAERKARLFRDRIMNDMIKGYVSKETLDENFAEIDAALTEACEAMNFDVPISPIDYFFNDI